MMQTESKAALLLAGLLASGCAATPDRVSILRETEQADGNEPLVREDSNTLSALFGAPTFECSAVREAEPRQEWKEAGFQSLHVKEDLHVGGSLRVGDNTLYFLNNVLYPPEPFISDLILSNIPGDGGQIGFGRLDGDDFSGIKIGVGLGDPQHKLHLHNGPLAGFGSIPREVRSAWTNEETGKLSDDGLTVGIDVDGNASINQHEDRPLSLATHGIERVVVTNTGDVGIDVAQPQAKLHVAGTAGVDGIMFPDGTLQQSAARSVRSYDSGWFGVGVNANYVLTHNLGSTALLASIWFSKDSTGTTRCYGPAPFSWRDHNPEYDVGVAIAEVSESEVDVRTGCRFDIPSASPGCDASEELTGGFVRVVLLAVD